MATVSETVSKPASASTIRQNLPVFAETRQNSRSQTRRKPDWFHDSDIRFIKSKTHQFSNCRCTRTILSSYPSKGYGTAVSRIIKRERLKNGGE
jgi:hypothetical protein